MNGVVALTNSRVTYVPDEFCAYTCTFVTVSKVATPHQKLVPLSSKLTLPITACGAFTELKGKSNLGKVESTVVLPKVKRIRTEQNFPIRMYAADNVVYDTLEPNR